MIPTHRILLAYLGLITLMTLPVIAKVPTALLESGLIVMEIKPGDLLEKAGVRPGDILLSWQDLEDADDRVSPFNSVFDWWQLLEESARAKRIVLRVLRGQQTIDLLVEPGRWDATVHPRLAAHLLEVFVAGSQRLTAKNLEEGTSKWRELAGSLLERSDSELACWIHIEIARAWRKAGQPSNAIPTLQTSEPLCISPAALIALHQELGRVLQESREPEKARRILEACLDLQERHQGLTLGWATTKVLLGVLAWEQRKLDEARGHWLSALEVQEALAPNSVFVAEALSRLASITAFSSDFAAAERLSIRALDLTEKVDPDSQLLASILNTLANIRLSQGHVEEAESHFARALQIAKRESSQKRLAGMITNNLGSLAISRGDMEGAAIHFSKALEIWNELTPGSLEVALALSNLGNTFLNRGSPELAQDYYQRSLEIRRKIAPESLDTAGALNNLSVASGFLGNEKLAEQYQMEALQIQERLAPRSLNTAGSLLNVGGHAFSKRDLKKAESYYQRALDIYLKDYPYSLATANALAEFGILRKTQGANEEAQARFERSLELVEKISPDSEYSARIQFELAQSLALTNPTRAAELFENAVSNLDRLIADRAYLQAFGESYGREHALVYKRYMDLLLNQGLAPKAFQVLERYRARKFLSLLEERDLTSLQALPDEIRLKQRDIARRHESLQRRLAALRPEKDAASIEEILKEIREVEFQRAELVREIGRLSPQSARMSPGRALDLEAARRELPPGTLLLSYSLAHPNSYLFVLSPDGPLHVHRLDLEANALGEEIRQLLDLLQAHDGTTAGRIRSRAMLAKGKRLYDLLLKPAEPQIESARRLLIVPDGSLHALPWGVLIKKSVDTGSEGERPYLAESKSIHLALSATIYAQITEARPQTKQAGDLALFGDPVMRFDRVHPDPMIEVVVRKGFDLSPLPGSRSEVQRIAALFAGSAQTFLGERATEENAKALPRNSRIVHFAAHATLDNSSPLDSAVVLTSPNLPDEAQENGLLHAWEIFEQVRLDADLVVLSACESGLGKEMGGEGLIGLTRAFQYAGARSVMASLWKISDRTTAEFMVRFYRHLKEGLSKDEALRATQMEFIRGPIQVTNDKGERVEFDASAPYYWAAFQVYGDWQ
jgi:CHAT domain-containing protein/Tfp pilus assembly protein PilF